MTSKTEPTLPPLPDRTLLARLCRETAERERVQPFMVEKDFFLTRLLWALGQAAGDLLLLKGGTLLSKVDLGFRRMSEDADSVVPHAPQERRRDNVVALNRVQRILKDIVPGVGVTLPFPDGEHHDKGAHTPYLGLALCLGVWEPVADARGVPTPRHEASSTSQTEPVARRRARRLLRRRLLLRAR